MLTLDVIRQRLLEIAREEFGGARIDDVLVEPYVDPDGDRAIRATIILSPRKAQNLAGKKLAAMTNRANDLMQEFGDARFIFTHYATSKELKELTAAND